MKFHNFLFLIKLLKYLKKIGNIIWYILAPNGCLQYYKSTSGTVTSFNYGTTVNSRCKYKNQ